MSVLSSCCGHVVNQLMLYSKLSYHVLNFSELSKDGLNSGTKVYVNMMWSPLFKERKAVNDTNFQF